MTFVKLGLLLYFELWNLLQRNSNLILQLSTMKSTLEQNDTVDDCFEAAEVFEIEDKRQKHNEAQRRYR